MPTQNVTPRNLSEAAGAISRYCSDHSKGKAKQGTVREALSLFMGYKNSRAALAASDDTEEALPQGYIFTLKGATYLAQTAEELAAMTVRAIKDADYRIESLSYQMLWNDSNIIYVIDDMKTYDVRYRLDGRYGRGIMSDFNPDTKTPFITIQPIMAHYESPMPEKDAGQHEFGLKGTWHILSVLEELEAFEGEERNSMLIKKEALQEPRFHLSATQQEKDGSYSIIIAYKDSEQHLTVPRFMFKEKAPNMKEVVEKLHAFVHEMHWSKGEPSQWKGENAIEPQYDGMEPEQYYFENEEQFNLLIDMMGMDFWEFYNRPRHRLEPYYTQHEPWKTFWFEGNQYFDWVYDRHDWERLVKAYEGLGQYRDKAEVLQSLLSAKQDVGSKKPKYGFAMECRGEHTLNSFFRENGMTP